MLIFTENGWKGFMTIKTPRETTLAAERMNAEAARSYAEWLKAHEELQAAGARRRAFMNQTA